MYRKFKKNKNRTNLKLSAGSFMAALIGLERAGENLELAAVDCEFILHFSEGRYPELGGPGEVTRRLECVNAKLSRDAASLEYYAKTLGEAFRGRPR